MILSQSIIFLPIICAVIIYVFNKRWINYLAFLSQALLTVVVIKLWQIVSSQGTIFIALGGWSKAIGVELAIDYLSLLFMSMAVIMWWAVLFYAWSQRSDDFKFIFFLMFLEGAFLAFLQVNDFFTLFVLLEIITITSSILILYKKDGLAIKAGLYYLLFNSFGMVLYLFGVLLLYLEVGTLNMGLVHEYLLEFNFLSVDFSLLHVSFACLFIAMCVKSALFPVYEWLPRAHTAAPASISALLSGLLVKSGIYGLIRIIAIFEVHNINTLMFYLGFFTALAGILFAVSQNDIKAMLAFSTISQIGLIVMGLAAATDVGTMSSYLHLFNHFLAKSILFFGAGILINEYGFRRVTQLKGIFVAHPYLSIAMMAAILSMVGSPLTVGFISKNMIKLSMNSEVYVYLYRIVSIGTLLVFIRFSKIFFGEPLKLRKIQKGQAIGVGILWVTLVLAFFIELPALETYMGLPDAIANKELIQVVSYIGKSLYDGYYMLDFLLMVLASCAVYYILVKPRFKFWRKIRQFRIKFQDAILSLVVFLVVVLLVI
jgi:multicomponent Na+:H+ antiporter subunit D